MLDPEHEYNFADEDAVDLMQRVHEVRTRTGFAIEAPAIHEDQSCEQIMADAEGYAAAGELYAVEQVWMQYIAHELDVRGEEAESAARELHDEATARMKGGSPVVWPPDIRPESPAREKPEDLSVAAKAFGYRSEDAGLRGYWNFANTLGEGGYGRAGLWVQNDRHWNVIDVGTGTSTSLTFLSVTDVSFRRALSRKSTSRQSRGGATHSTCKISPAKRCPRRQSFTVKCLGCRRRITALFSTDRTQCTSSKGYSGCSWSIAHTATCAKPLRTQGTGA